MAIQDLWCILRLTIQISALYVKPDLPKAPYLVVMGIFFRSPAILFQAPSTNKQHSFISV